MDDTVGMALRRWLTTLVRRDPGPDARTKAEAVQLLGGEGCPVCRVAEDAVRRWFHTYENESRSDPRMRERIERSFGFCATHTRHLLDLGASSSWLARWVFADVARAGTAALRVATVPTPEACPACEVAARAVTDTLGTLAVGLVDDEARSLLDAGDGLCVTHGVAVIERSGPVVARAVAEMLESRLGKDPVLARDHLIGLDPDRSRRRRAREERAERVLAAEETSRRRGSAADLVLDWPCCPLCAAADRVEWRYLHWLAGLSRDESAELRAEAMLCPRHLGDLTSFRHVGDLSDRELTDDGLLGSVAAVIDHVAGLWRADLHAFLQRLDASPWAGIVHVQPPRGVESCQLCARKRAAEQREARLLEAIAADPAYDARLSRAHGVCLRHGLTTELPPAWRRLLRARVGLLSFELDEAERKAGWDARWEVRGSEMAAWRRAPTLLDGAVLGPIAPDSDPPPRTSAPPEPPDAL